jgi:hypothetical protein
VDKPQYTSIPLEELRRIEADIQRVRSVDDLRLLFDRLSAIRRTFIDNFDVQLAVGDVQQAIVDRGRILQDNPFEARHSSPPPVDRQTADVFLSDDPKREEERSGEHQEETAADAGTRSDVQAIDARSWKRATYIGAFFAVILFAAFFYLIQTARKLNIDSVEQQPNQAGPVKNAANQQKPNPAAPAGGAAPASTSPTLRLYTDLSPGTVTIDGGTAQPLQDGELQIDALKPGPHAVKLTGRTGSAAVNFNAADKSSPSLTGPPAGDNALVVTVSTQGGQGRLMTNAQNPVAILDGKEIGPIPATGLELSNLGQTDHDLQVRQGTDLERFVLTYVPAPALTVFVKNDLNAGNLVIITGEDGADVFINNQKYKRRTDHGQLRLPGLKVGPYVIRVAKPGFIAPPPQTVEIKKGEEAKVAFQLKPQPQPQLASLEVSGAQPGTQVLIDGAPVATTGDDGNAKAAGIAPGGHQVEVKHDGSQTKQLQRSFTAGETLTLTGPDVALAKTPPAEPPAPATAATPKPSKSEEPATALAAAEAEPSTMPASIHRGGGFLIYHSTKAPGQYVFTMQLRRGGGFLKSKHLQWFLGFQDTRNYLLFQVDGKHFVVREVVDGKGDDLRKESFDVDPEGYVQIDMAVKAHSVDTRLRPNDGNWRDMGSVTGITTDLTQGKFGILISGNDEIGISTVHYGK